MVIDSAQQDGERSGRTLSNLLPFPGCWSFNNMPRSQGGTSPSGYIQSLHCHSMGLLVRSPQTTKPGETQGKSKTIVKGRCNYMCFWMLCGSPRRGRAALMCSLQDGFIPCVHEVDVGFWLITLPPSASLPRETSSQASCEAVCKEPC